MIMMVLVSKQHKVTTKYKMPAKKHFALFVNREKTSYKNAGQVDIAAGQVYFTSYLPCMTSSCVDFFGGLTTLKYCPVQ